MKKHDIRRKIIFIKIKHHCNGIEVCLNHSLKAIFETNLINFTALSLKKTNSQITAVFESCLLLYTTYVIIPFCETSLGTVAAPHLSWRLQWVFISNPPRGQ